MKNLKFQNLHSFNKIKKSRVEEPKIETISARKVILFKPSKELKNL